MNRSRGRRGVCSIALFALSALDGCRSRAAAPLYLVMGPEAAQHVEFRPLSSYAEYVVVPGQRTELTLTLASYPTSCDSFVPPGDHDTSATVTLIVPFGSELGPGHYAWAGHPAHGGESQQPLHAYALPTVRVGHVSAVLEPGGELELESVATTQEGRVRGRLDFEFPGDAERVATSLKGSFEAKLCRVRL